MRVAIIFCVLLFSKKALTQQAVINFTFCNYLHDTAQLVIINNLIEEYEPKLRIPMGRSYTLKMPDIQSPLLAYFYYGENFRFFIVEPGDSINFSIPDDSSFNPIISGKGSEKTNFLFLYNQHFEQEQVNTKINKMILADSNDSIEIFLTNLRNEQLDFLNTKSIFSAYFKNYIEQKINFDYLNSLLTYFINYRKTEYADKLICNIDSTLEMLDSQVYQIINPDYRNFIDNYITLIYKYDKVKNPEVDINFQVENKISLAKKRLKGESLLWYIANLLNNYCSQMNAVALDSLYTELKSLDVDDDYAHLINLKCKKHINEKSNQNYEKNDNHSGKLAKSAIDNLELYDVNGNKFKFESIEGKVVIIDFWASWCGPCLREIPEFKHLIAKFDSTQMKEIVLLFISFDENKASWKNAMNKFEIDGSFFIAKKGLNSPEVMELGITSIPHYIILNKNGMFVDMDAPHLVNGIPFFNELKNLFIE